MPLSPSTSASTAATGRCFGLRIEHHLLHLAIATPLPDGRYRIEMDDVPCSDPGGWLTASGSALLAQAIETLVDRHEMRRRAVAVSLDGDFCVTRVTMGTSEEVDAELAMLATRVPRYLQLGPGEKVVGSSRLTLAPTVDYAVTGVVNRSLIQCIYEALRQADLEVAWVEPSLVSVARLVGQAQIGEDRPVMIADGTGRQWDVGIACSGRLLLDYRPASANTEEAFRDALDGHLSRLKRFCHRHRGVVTGELTRLLICGTGHKPHRAVEILGDSLGVEPEVLSVPSLTDLYEIDERDRQSHCVPAVATVLPLLTGVIAADVPDLLSEVRRAPELPWARRLVQTGWPVAAALLMLCITYGLVSSQRRLRSGLTAARAEMQSRIDAAEVKFDRLTRDRELIAQLHRIEGQTAETHWDLMFGRVTQSLPDRCRLAEFRVEPGGHVRLDGFVLDEALVYDLVNILRRLPDVTQVALKGTAPNDTQRGTRFDIRLTTVCPPLPTDSGARDE
jgi:hypothetical protein